MEGKGSISEYRRKLDKTLASPDLTNDEMLHTLVKQQILQSSDLHLEGYLENVVDRRRREVSSFLSMLRSASVNTGEESHSGWKVKQDTEEYRVMYREGPEGTPFHTLLVEGYIDGPVDVCLCISCESSLYQKWWPQTAVPTFKVVSSRCIKRVRTGEQISLVRMKVSWPLSSREALVHIFAFEYFQDDLIILLLNSISDSETIDRSTHGFTRDGIPDAEEVVRIDVVGGFALQKVSADRSYFRTIANMDLKLDFVPPAFINFVSRQLIGSGFKLYKKEVASVSKGDEKFLEALKDPLYTRIRKALYSGDAVTNRNDLNEIEEIQENDTKESVSLDNCTLNSSNRSTSEIMEKFRSEKEECVVSTKGKEAPRPTNVDTRSYGSEIKKNVHISPEVEQALETLDKVISIFREPKNDRSGINKQNLPNLGKEAVGESMPSETDQISRNNGNFAESSYTESQEFISIEPGISSISTSRRIIGSSSNSYTRETNQSKIVPAASPDEEQSAITPSHSNNINLHSPMINQKTNSSTVHEKITESYPPNDDAKGTINGNRATKREKRNSRFCCLHFISAQ